MKKKLLPFAVGIVLVVSNSIFAQTTRYVSTSGVDTANDCSLPGNPCATLAAAYTASVDGDSIKIAAGQYDLTSALVIEKTVSISALVATAKPIFTTTSNDFFLVNAEGIEFKNLILNMGLTATSGLRGIVSTQNFDLLKLTNNEFVSTNSADVDVTQNFVWGAFAVSLVSPADQFYTVEIKNNKVIAESTFKLFGRGLYLGGNAGNAPGGVIEGNELQAYYAIQAARVPSNLDILDNQINGTSMINVALNNAVITIENNTFNADQQLTPMGLYAVVEFRAIENGSINFAANQVSGYVNIGLLSSASKAISVVGNTFTPAATAENFASIMANTKMMTTGVQGNTYSDEISLIGNTFNAGATDKGSAIVFADHFGVNTPAFNAITIGGATAVEKNVFASQILKYIVLDNQIGNSQSFPLWATYAQTTMRPFATNLEALVTNNTYNVANMAALEAKFDHKNDNTDLGLITFTSNGDRYVATTGADAANDCTDENAPCKTIAYALTVAQDLESVIIAAGNYTETEVLEINSNGTSVHAAVPANRPLISTTKATLFDVNATNVTIENLQFELGLNATTGMVGVESTSGVFNKLAVKNNQMNAIGAPGTQPWTWNSFGVRLFSQGTNLDTVTISNNVIGSFTNEGKSTFGRGVYLGSGSATGASATITSNEIAAFYALQLVSNTGDVVANNNDFFGGIMVNAPLADVAVEVTNNRFDVINDELASFFYALADVRAIENGSVLLENNEFNNYTTIGALSMASKNVELINNTFTPLATAEEFVSIVANSKLMTTGVQGTTYGNEIVIKGNTFNAGVADKGTAISFADHYGVTSPAFASITVGGTAAADKNNFDNELKNYFVIDDKTGASTTVPLWAGYAETTMKPFDVSFEALYVNNTYNYDLIPEVEAKIIDKLENEVLGKVILGESPLSVNGLTIEAINVFPNPSTSYITVDFGTETQQVEATIMDLVGNVVFAGTIKNQEKIDVSSFTNGIYLVNLSDGQNGSTIKFLKK